jgi:hypothetical protein
MQARPVRVPRPFAALLLLLPLAAGLVLAGLAGARGTALPTLYVNYTINCTFTILDDSGRTVTSIPPGNYQVQVTTPGSFSGVDLAGVTGMTACKGAAQFQLTGPGVNIQTSLNDGDGSQDVLSGSFQPSSTYVAVDNNQPSVTRTTFTTQASGGGTAGGSTTTTSGTTTSGGKTTTTTPAGPIAGTLVGAVSSAGKATLTFKGKAILTLPAGVYKFTVSDKSSKSGFFIQAQHGKATTVSSASHIGTSTATVNLTSGQWFFYSAATGPKSAFAVTTGLYG